MIGQQIRQFKITEKLGAGGMGEVYVAEDTRLKRRVALKFLPPHYSADPDFKARFEHEATAAAALNHPNIVTVYELGDHDGRLFIALELVEGRSLEQMIEAGDVKVSTAVKIAQQAAEGLAAAHDAGIVHRDIKPANILVDKSGRVKILDFGLAKSRRATTETKVGTTVGTIQYESPEQGRGDAVDQRSDLFSLGVVLYELIAGRRPFTGEFTDAIRYAIANETPDPLARYTSDVPDDLQRIVSKLLEKDPELRYQSATGLISDLKLLQRASGPTPSSVHSSYHPVAGAPAGPPAKRRVGRIVFPALAFVVIAALALIFKPWKIDIQTTHEASAGEDRLAVMYFENMTDPDDSDRKGSIVANLLISALSGSDYLQVVSSQRLYDVLKQIGQEGARVITPDIASQVAKKATAKWMLTGSIMQSSPSWVISAQLVDVATGNVLASPTVRGRPGEEIFDVVDRLTAGIKGDLALPAEALAELDRPVMQLTSSSADAYALYIQGRDLENEYRKAEAEQSFLAALQIDSTFAMAHYALAGIRITLWNDPVGAGAHLRAAVRHADRASALDRQYITALSDWFDNHPEKAVAIYEQIIREHPDEKEAYQMLATAFRLAKPVQNLNRSIELYQKMLELDPDYAEAYNSMAYVYNELGSYEKSLEAVNNYIRLEPDKPNPYDSRAELQARNGQVEASLASYLKAIEIDSTFSSAYDGAIAMNMFLGRYADAERLVRYFLDQENPDARARGQMIMVELDVYRGHFKAAMGRLNLAVKDLEGAQTPTFNSFRFLGRKADLHALRGDWDAMRKVNAQLASVARPLDSTGRFNAGVTLNAMVNELRAGDKARMDSLRGELPPEARDLMGDGYDLALACQAMLAGHGDSTLVHLKEFAGDVRSFGDLYWLGRGYAVAGQTRDAIQTYEQAIDNYGQSRWGHSERAVWVYYELARAYDKSGRRDKAQELYREFLEIWNEADTEVAEIKDAKKRLAELGT